VQREVLDQIVRLREEYGFAIVFTTHDLALLLEISDSVAVMRRGRLVEYGPAMDVYRDASTRTRRICCPLSPTWGASHEHHHQHRAANRTGAIRPRPGGAAPRQGIPRRRTCRSAATPADHARGR